MERKVPYASQEEFKKHVVHYPDVPSIELAPGSNSHLVSAEKIMLSIVTLSPNSQSSASHRHEEEQVAVVLDGEFDEIVEGKFYHLKKGDVLILPPNTEHGAFICNRGCQVIDIFSPPREALAAKLKEVLGEKRETETR